jgi:plasmid stabilization system protein ParE
MSVRKTDDFIADVERQFEWYALNANWEIAGHYLDAVEATVQLLKQHPQLGPRGGFNHPRLREWRFFVVFRPFNKHVLFYELSGGEIVMRRAMHGHRDLPRRLLES